MLTWAGEDDAIVTCAIIGGILAIPGGIVGAIFESILRFSILGAISTTIGEMLQTTGGRFIVNAVRAFFLPFIVAVIIFIIAA